LTTTHCDLLMTPKSCWLHCVLTIVHWGMKEVMLHGSQLPFSCYLKGPLEGCTSLSVKWGASVSTQLPIEACPYRKPQDLHIWRFKIRQCIYKSYLNNTITCSNLKSGIMEIL
jgi:hypothetical protein